MNTWDLFLCKLPVVFEIWTNELKFDRKWFVAQFKVIIIIKVGQFDNNGTKMRISYLPVPFCWGHFIPLGQIHVRACWKNLTFPNDEFGKGHYAIYPIKLFRLAKKINYARITKISNWVKIFQKSNIIVGVLGIQTSWIHLNMANHSTTSHFQKELEP